MKPNLIRKIAASILSVSFMFPVNSYAAEVNNAKNGNDFSETNINKTYDEESYAIYQKKAGYEIIDATVNIPLEKSSASKNVEFVQSYEGYNGTVAITGDDSTLEYNIEIPKTGKYRIFIEYFPVAASTQSIQRAVFVDGAVSFSEAACIDFYRVYEDIPYEDAKGTANEVRPMQLEKAQWLSTYCKDNLRYFGDSLYWNLDAGTHKITFVALREPLAIRKISLLSNETKLDSYDDYIINHEAKGAVKVQGALSGGSLKHQAEDMFEKSTQTLFAANDRSSPGTEPYDPNIDKLNYIGATKWAQPGQWVTWQVDVPETGFYHLAFRSRQNTLRGTQVYRSLYINGIIPFDEASRLKFSYSDKWKVDHLGDGDTPYLFYLEKGPCELRMEVVLGELTEILGQAQNILSTLNDVNWNLMTILGTDPDLNRDYEIDKIMPHIITALKTQSQALLSICTYLESETGEIDQKTAVLRQIIRQLVKMEKFPRKIATNYSAFKDNIGALGAWILDMRKQPLSLDYLLLVETDKALPKSEPSFFVMLSYHLHLFFSSFIKDYNVVGSEGEQTKDSLVVWLGSGVTGGRDQAQSLHQMVQQDFVKKHNVPVNLQLTPAGTILVATLSGKGPDVALQLGDSTPVDFAMRNTVINLKDFKDFDEISSRFTSSALLPFRYQGGVYALPETQNFYVMFYRKDILSKLGIDYKDLKTWKDMVDILGTLQESNMSIALPSSYLSYVMFLNQMGGSLYNGDGQSSALDDEVSIQAFIMWTNFFVNYQIPIEYNFENRFRLGEMPIGIAEYTNYNLLSVSAPEIQGLWDIAPLPGIMDESGKINNSSPSTAGGAIILSDCKNVDGAWEFLKWWTSAEIQKDFGSELESILGEAARYNTANREAAASLPWSAEDRKILASQWDTSKGIPQVPGGYYTSRSLDFALRKVVNNNESPRDTLLSYIEVINQELAFKRAEFNLD